MGDSFVDIVEFFQIVTKQSDAAQQKYKEFVDFLHNSIIQKVQKGGKILGSWEKKYQNLSGLGIFFPKSRQELEKYRYLKVFSDLKVVKLFEAILFT